MALPPISAIGRRLYTPVVCDVLDRLGWMHQAMTPSIRPLDEALVVFGRVRTGRFEPVGPAAVSGNEHEDEIRLIESLRPGEVPVLACGEVPACASPWGELAATAARSRGAAGCVTDGLVRDVRRIRTMGFPVFHAGIGPLDSRGRMRMVERDVPVTVGGVQVFPGDWILGDADGVVVVPNGKAEEVFAAALAKVEREDATRIALEAGEPLSGVFARYGVF